MTSKYTLHEVFYELSKIERVIAPDWKEFNAQITKQSRAMAKRFPDTFPVG